MSEITRITMTTQEAAEYLGVGYTKMLQLIAAREVPFVKLGRLYYFTKDKLDQWLESEMSKPTKEQQIVDLMNRKYR